MNICGISFYKSGVLRVAIFPEGGLEYNYSTSKVESNTSAEEIFEDFQDATYADSIIVDSGGAAVDYTITMNFAGVPDFIYDGQRKSGLIEMRNGIVLAFGVSMNGFDVLMPSERKPRIEASLNTGTGVPNASSVITIKGVQTKRLESTSDQIV